MDSIFDKYYENLTICGCILAAFLNLFALPLSIRMSKYTLGSFKIIMLVFSTNNMLHMLTDVFILPRLYFQNHFVILYSSGVIRHWGDGIATFGPIWACTIFMLQVFLEAVHFVYRYVLLCKRQYKYLLTVRNLSKILFISYTSYFLFFSAVFTFLTDFDDDIYEEIGNHSLEKIGLSARELHGVVYYYFTEDPQGTLTSQWKGCLAVFCVVPANFTLILSIFYCGYKIQGSFKNQEARARMSVHTLEMNKTLFQMLIAQTAVPLVLLHAPTVVILLGPFFYEIGEIGEILIPIVLSYSVFEPTIVVYFLMRKRIKKTLKRIASAASSKVQVLPQLTPVVPS